MFQIPLDYQMFDSRIPYKFSILILDNKIKTKTITSDRGREFTKHVEITQELNGVQFYFPDPQAPW